MKKTLGCLLKTAVAFLVAATGAATADILFEDSFSGYPQASRGIPLWQAESGEWQVVDGAFRGQSCPGHFSAEGTRTGHKAWTDYRLELRFRVVSRGADWRDGPWIGFRYGDAGNAYTLGFYTLGTCLHKASGGRSTGDDTELASSPRAIGDTSWHRVSIRTEGADVTVTLDGEMLFRVEDKGHNDSPPLAAGNIVLCARDHDRDDDAKTVVLFDDVAVHSVADTPAEWRYTVADAMAAGAPGMGMLSFVNRRRDRRFANLPHRVLAFYYTWYGNPEHSGSWVHWDNVRPEKHDIGTSTHYPALGAYDSHDPELISTHIRQAKEAGVDTFISTWWGRGNFEDRAFGSLLKHAEELDFNVAAYWETAPGTGQEQVDRAVGDLAYLAETHGKSAAYLKVDGEPVVFVYGRVLGEVPLQNWPAIIDGVKKRLGYNVILVADGYRDMYARVFDGLHVYNIAGATKGRDVPQLRAFASQSFPAAVQTARKRGAIACVTIIPGYDDTKIRTPGLVAERYGGEAYRTLWSEAIKADADWVVITSWNEWHEGSEIEPSWEDGDLYLKLTRKCSRDFKRRPSSRVPVVPVSTIPAAMAASIRKRFAGITVGLMPDLHSEAPFWLAGAGVDVRELSWRDMVDTDVLNAGRLPILLYASGEQYVQSFREQGDVDEALRRYLRQGGLLIVIPSQPAPFFYNEKRTAVRNAYAFGLPILGSAGFEVLPNEARTLRNAHPWEEPPPGKVLTFRMDRTTFPSVAAALPFPVTGDQRWRPAVPGGSPEASEYKALARLVDSDGASYGDGIVFVHHETGPLKGAKLLYIWLRMPDMAGEEAFYHDLFTYAAREVGR